MSTATFPAAGPISVHHRAFWRCAWKEYRMLRALWLAVAALAVMIQLITVATLTQSADLAEMLFSTALGATVLYAVGAAATLFAVEHEEETYDLLTSLPAEWSPVFFAKLLVTAVSSAALLVVLVGSSLALGGVWNSDAALLLLPAIGEAIAWGIFMSLVIRRPLVAAVATIAVVSVQVNLVMSSMTEHAVAIAETANYPQALWWRLAIAAAVLLVDVALGREWLRAREGQRFSFRKRSATPAVAGTTESARTVRVSTLRMMSRLLWQTWRESWVAMGLTLIFAITFGLFGTLLVLRVLYTFGHFWFAPLAIVFVVLCVLSALYGSQVFAADHRGGRYRFLADHAVRPRIVWLCRHAAWLGILLAVIAVLIGTAAPYFLQHMSDRAEELAEDLIRRNDWSYGAIPMLQLSGTVLIWSVSGIAAVLAGYSIGQFASLVVRRSISAGFLAALLAIVVSCWGMIVDLWDLSPTAFVLPIALGFFVATWLRIPDWLIERPSIGSWAKMLLAIGVPLVAIFGLVPYARQAQVSALNLGSFAWLMDDDVMDDFTSSDLPGHREAEEMLRLAESVERPPDVEELNAEDDKYRSLDWKRRFAEKNQEILQRAMELSNISVIQFPTYADHSTTVSRLTSLAHLVISAGEVDQSEGKLREALEKYVAALRLLGHMRRGQTTRTIRAVLNDDESRATEAIAKWASHPGQSKELLLEAIEGLNQTYPNTPEERVKLGESARYVSPKMAHTNDYGVLREVILGQRQPRILDDENATLADHLAVLANRLLFERQRALQVLAAIATEESSKIQRFQWLLDGAPETRRQSDKHNAAQSVRNTFEQMVRESWYGELLRTDARTSYLLFKELDARFDLRGFLEAIANQYVRQLGLKLQLALIAYGLDHGEYPENLYILVPEYLPSVPIDPFSGELFKYEPNGIAGNLVWPGSLLQAYMPFVWSVGINNNRIAPVYGRAGGEGAVEALEQDPIRQIWPDYQFEPTELNLRYYLPLVFPLPPIESGDDSTPPADKTE